MDNRTLLSAVETAMRAINGNQRASRNEKAQTRAGVMVLAMLLGQDLPNFEQQVTTMALIFEV